MQVFIVFVRPFDNFERFGIFVCIVENQGDILAGRGVGWYFAPLLENTSLKVWFFISPGKGEGLF